MSKQSHSVTSNGVERKRPKTEYGSPGKRAKPDPIMEDDNGNQIEEATTTQQEETNTISAEEFFVGVLDKIPRGSKKKTLNSFIRTLLQLKDTVTDEDDIEDDLPIKAVEPPVINPIVLPEPAPQPLSISPLAVEKCPNPVITSYAPTTTASGSTVVVSYSPVVKTSVRESPAKMTALEACPPLTSLRAPAASLAVPQGQPHPPPVNPQDIIRAQHQIRQEKVKMIPPQTMSPMDASIQQKERAFHQAALQQQQLTAPQMQISDSDALLVANLKNKILMSIQSNHDGKATDEDINRYLRQNFFMILDNNQYIYVPNPWIHRPQYIKQFMSQPPGQPQPQPQPTLMLPPRLPQMQMQSMPQISQIQSMPQIQNIQGNLLHHGQVLQGLNPAVSTATSLPNWPNQQNILLNTLQPNLITTSQGVSIINSPKAGRSI